jgi:GntR family transcriptional regulator
VIDPSTTVMTDALATGTQTFAPLYKEVKRRLTASLAAGEWEPGAALPSETRLAERFQVSIGTIRKAVDELVGEQVLIRQQGRGTFVAIHDNQRLLFHFFHVVPERGPKVLPEPELVSFTRAKADADVALRLQIAPGDRIILIENLLRLSGRPVVLDEIVLAAAMFPDLTEKTFRERGTTIYNFYQMRYSRNIVRAVERLRAATADRATAALLEIQPGAPVLVINRVALTYHDAPVELRKSRVNTAHHEYLADLGRTG